ncbi:hypothetical protein DH2020_026339 [Rehmannia glutinosa]|uniref:protein O-GlcNAc transferase n=1 Tax=Rehmannia glutinosa TaxID=99300 RepID=A0ABR0VXG3_REHGL
MELTKRMLTMKKVLKKDALSYANILRSRNKFVDAFAVYESVLEKDGENVEAHIGKGICLQMQNLGRLAYESFTEPAYFVAKMRSRTLQKPSAFVDYVESPVNFYPSSTYEMYQKALKADPSYKLAAECLAIVLTDLGTSLKLAGNAQEGIQKYYEAIRIDPHYAAFEFDVPVFYMQPAYYNLGVVYSEMMQYDTALNCYEKAAIERPMYAEAYCNMGVIYKNRSDLESAIACYERCLTVSPNFEIAKNNMAIALTDLGTKVKLEGDINHGVAYYKKALYYNWHYADAMYNLGVAYGEMLKFDMMALSIKPNFSQSLNNLGVVYTVQGKMDAAASMIEKAIVANPTYAEAYNNLGVLYRDAGNISLAVEAYEQCLKIDPDSRNAGQCTQQGSKPNRLLAMNYINEGTDDKLYEAHREWGRRFMRLFPQYTSWDNIKDPERPLVIGYVSPDYFTHSVSYFIEAPLIYHDYANYKVVVYSAVVKADAKTNRFRDKVLKHGGTWRDIYGIDEKKVASLVREDKVDILVELTGHTANNKLGMMACRPAPVQVTWIGYPNTTGLPTIDYRISDALADPVDTKQKHVEELVRLPDSFLCYTPSPEAGPVSPAPALSNGFVTFGSFNNLAKITPRVLQVWARILCAVPNSRLIVKCKPFCCDSVRQQFLSTLEKLGLESLRVDLLPLIILNHDHMQAYSLMDIRIEQSGGQERRRICRASSTVGLDITALSNLRMRLRDLMLKSPLCDGSKFAQGLESAYRNMWQRYCKNDVPSLRRMEIEQLQSQQQLHSQQVIPEEVAVSFPEPKKVNISPIKANGFNLGQCSSLNTSRGEENGSLLNQNSNLAKLN